MLAALSSYELGRISTVPGAPAWIAPQDGAPRLGRTEPASAPPNAQSPLRKIAIAGAVAIVALGGAAALALAGMIDLSGLLGTPSPSTSNVSPGPTASGGVSTASSAASGGARPPSPFASLVGRWKSDTNRDYEAVVSGNVLEFRILDASQYPRQGYRNGDARFTLTAVRGQDRVFGVEDHIRPVPPAGVEYDETRARPSCQEVWSSFGGQNLRAEFDGTRLTVDLVKIETRSDRFQTERDKVVACRTLKEAATSKIESVLLRVGG
jgi:serine/threonine-protein kinase